MARLNYNRLGDRLLAGAMPFRAEHVDALASEGVTVVVNLCEDREYWQDERELVKGAYLRAGITEHQLPVIDGSTVPAAVLAEAVRVSREATVYVHCRGGRERSAAVSAAIILATEGLTVEGALEKARRLRPIFRPLPWQVHGLEAWAATA